MSKTLPTASDDRDALVDLLVRAQAELRRLHSGVIPLADEIALALGQHTPEDLSAMSILDAWKRGFASFHAKARRELEQIEREQRSDAEYRTKYEAEGESDQKVETQYLAGLQERIADARRTLADCDRTALAIQADPLALLLPIATVVRVASDIPTKYPVPRKGSVGVVAGYRATTDRPNLVAFIDEVTDTNGDVGEYDEDRTWKLHFRSDELEIVQHSTLIGESEPNNQVGYRPTHVHEDGSRLLWGDDMLFEAIGWTWRIQLINGLPENTQVHRDTGYFVGPKGWMKPYAERTQ